MMLSTLLISALILSHYYIHTLVEMKQEWKAVNEIVLNFKGFVKYIRKC